MNNRKKKNREHIEFYINFLLLFGRLFQFIEAYFQHSIIVGIPLMFLIANERAKYKLNEKEKRNER